MKALEGGAQTEASQRMKRDWIKLGTCRHHFQKADVRVCFFKSLFYRTRFQTYAFSGPGSPKRKKT